MLTYTKICSTCGIEKDLLSFCTCGDGDRFFADHCLQCHPPKPAPLSAFEKRLRHNVSWNHKRALKYGVKSTFTVEEWKELLEVSGGQCYYCKEDIGIEYLTIEHCVPLSRLGTNTLDNIVPACKRCNTKKGYRHPAGDYDWSARREQPVEVTS